MQIINDTAHSRYLLHDNGIYEMVYKDASRTAVQEIFGYERELIRSSTPDQTLLQLICFEAGLPPVKLIFQNIKYSSGTNSPMMKNLPKMRVAIVYKDAGTLSLLNTIIKALRLLGTPLKSFPVAEREKAVSWLLESKSGN